jgi:hypothetical protein
MEQLPPRERLLLRELARLRLVTTGQLARLAGEGLTGESAGRVTRRHLRRLERDGLVRRFANRARDRRVGAPGHLYALTARGVRVTGAGSGIGVRQRRAYRPSPAFVDHRLATSELYVQLRECERRGGAQVRAFEAEPDCWRSATGAAGQQLWVRPDALVRLVMGETEVSWFVEIDRGDAAHHSESTTVIAAKLQAYLAYELTGDEQRRHGVYPAVVFIVPSATRAQQIGRTIAKLPVDARGLFVVATAEEAVAVLTRVEDGA